MAKTDERELIEKFLAEREGGREVSPSIKESEEFRKAMRKHVNYRQDRRDNKFSERRRKN